MNTPLQQLSRPHRNKLLAYLDVEDLLGLQPHLQLVRLEYREQLYDYLPTSTFRCRAWWR